MNNSIRGSRLLPVSILISLASFFLSGCIHPMIRKELTHLRWTDVTFAEKQFAREFSGDPDEIYRRILESIGRMEGEVVLDRKYVRMVVAYNFEKAFPSVLNMTEVGIVVKESGPAWKVIVASDNSNLAAQVSAKIFEDLGRPTSVR